jgi:hypothetical protein
LEKKSEVSNIRETQLVLILIGLMLLEREEADKTVSESKDRYLLQRVKKVKFKTF